MTKHGGSRAKREEEWRGPSGRAPRPVGVEAAIRRLLRTHGGARNGSRARMPAPASPYGASSRRVVVKVRVVQVGNDWGKKAAKLHVSYLERDGVARDGSPGELYGENGAVDRTDFHHDIPGEQHQFRIVLSPEDGHELELDEYVRTYMDRVENDLGQKLRWAAVSHYNTDNPHAHVIIRGIDAQGAEVRMGREYVAHGLRLRAVELANEELGPRPERSRIDQLKREAELERYTSLDRALERRAPDGVFRPGKGQSRDPHLEAAMRSRLEVLAQLGLASRKGRAEWQLDPQLRAELDLMGHRADAVRAIRSVVPVSANRFRIVDRSEPAAAERQELDRGVQGILRWKGLDEAGQFCVVVETTAGAAYHLPVSNRAAAESRVGQVIEIKRSVDKDQRIEEDARKQGWTYDTSAIPEGARAAYRARLEQLERMGLAARDPSAPERWRVRPDFRAEVARGKPQAYWQVLSVRRDPQLIEQQKTYPGYVWLDRVRLEELAPTPFGTEVREALRIRHEHLRGLGLEPGGGQLRFQLIELQRARLEQAITTRGGIARHPTQAFEGTARVHVAENGQQFVELRSSTGRFTVVPAFRNALEFEGRSARLNVGDQGRIGLELLPSNLERGKPDRGGLDR